MRQQEGQVELGQGVEEAMSDVEPQAPEPDPLAGLDPVRAANLRPTLFRKGQSGNPGGRPKVYQALSEYIRGLGGPDGRLYVDKLHAIAVGEHRDTRSRLAALESLLDRGWGRAPRLLLLPANDVRYWVQGMCQRDKRQIDGGAGKGPDQTRNAGVCPQAGELVQGV